MTSSPGFFGWTEYDPALHAEQLRSYANQVGFDWLEGEFTNTDSIMADFEATTKIALPEKEGPALDAARKLVSVAFRKGKKDVE